MKVIKILSWASAPALALFLYFCQPQLLWRLSNGLGVVVDERLVPTLAARYIPQNAHELGQEKGLQRTIFLLQALQVSSKLRHIPGLPSINRFRECTTRWGRSVCEWSDEGRALYLFFEIQSGLWTLVDIQGDYLEHWISHS